MSRYQQCCSCGGNCGGGFNGRSCQYRSGRRQISPKAIQAALAAWYGPEDRGPHNEDWQFKQMKAALLAAAEIVEVDGFGYATRAYKVIFPEEA